MFLSKSLKILINVFVLPEKGRITLMWSKLSLPESEPGIGNEWVPNHIVPLVSNVKRGPVQQMFKFFKETAQTSGYDSYSSRNRFQFLNDDVECVSIENDGSGQITSRTLDPAHCAPIVIPDSVDNIESYMPDLSTIDEEFEIYSRNVAILSKLFNKSESKSIGSGQSISNTLDPVDDAIVSEDDSDVTDTDSENEFYPGPQRQ